MEIQGKISCHIRNMESPTKRTRGLAVSASSYPCPTTEVVSFKDGCLPDWFLFEVLCRLPIKAVFRFKCVSKQWLSMISDPSFIRSYISSLQRWPWAILYKAMHVEGQETFHFSKHMLVKNALCSNNNLMTSPSMYVLPFPNSQEPKVPSYFIKATDNGLVLYGLYDVNDLHCDNDVTEYFICNPITMQWCALPQPKYPSRLSNAGLITQVDLGTLRSYRVVLVHCSYPRTTRYNFLEFEVFSSETGKWEEYIVRSEIAVRVHDNRKAVVMDGALHWEDCELGVVAYDPYNSPDKFCIIGFPAELDKSRNWIMGCLCGDNQGRLKYFEANAPYYPHPFSHFKIWVLEDYNSGHWYLEHVIKREDIIIGDTLTCSFPLFAFFISFHPYDADIIYLEWNCEMASYNIKTRRLEVLGTLKNTNFTSESCGYLVLPLWPISIPNSLLHL